MHVAITSPTRAPCIGHSAESSMTHTAGLGLSSMAWVYSSHPSRQPFSPTSRGPMMPVTA